MKIGRKTYGMMSPSELVIEITDLIKWAYLNYGDMTRNKCRQHINFTRMGLLGVPTFNLAFERMVEKGVLVKVGEKLIKALGNQKTDVYHFEINISDENRDLSQTSMGEPS